MCGIAGIYLPDLASAKGVDPQLLHAMADEMVHVDLMKEGFYTGRAMGLAFRRLSIVGHPPWTSAGLLTVMRPLLRSSMAKSINHLELRQMLETKGMWYSLTITVMMSQLCLIYMSYTVTDLPPI
ncbi:hypothetical protein P4S72_07770 [Vibrio sp. PP-XX7]